MPQAVDFIFTERTIEKLQAHGVTVQQLREVLANRNVLKRNRKQRAASHMLIGFDDHDRCLAIPVAPTDDPLIWRPITAWYCKPSEAAKVR
jgi:hypothetical protein